MNKNKIFILGAGLAGLSCAWHLKKKGIEADIFEKEDSVGGLCRSRKVDGFTFDCDGHLMHFQNGYISGLVESLLKGNLERHERSAWINNFGNLSRYPFQANLYSLPKKIAAECLWGFINATESRAKVSHGNFLKWINGTFGQGIARHFMLPYNSKFWTVPLGRMACPWTDKFIPKLGLAEVVNGFFGAGENHLGYNAYFWYPKKGAIEQLPLAFEKEIGGRVFKKSPVRNIDLKKREITIEGREREKFDFLILTIPLPELLKIINPLPEKVKRSLKRLRWNSIFNLNLGLEGLCQEDKHWIYFPNKETVFFRAGFFHNFSKNLSPSGKSSIYTETAYSGNLPFDRSGAVDKILAGLRKTGTINKENKLVAQDINDIKYGYPIYDRNYQEAINTIRRFLASRRIFTSGRYGNWRYMSMEDTMLDGKNTAEEVHNKITTK